MKNIKSLLTFIALASCGNVFCQPDHDNERHTHLEFEPKTVEVSGRGRDNSDRGSVNRHEPNEYRTRSTQTLPFSIVPLGYPEGISPAHKSSLQALRTLLKSIRAVEIIFAGTPIPDFLTDDEKKALAAITLRIINGDYPSLAGGISNMETIKQQQMADLAIKTTLDLDREYGEAGDNYNKREEVKRERKFWEGLQLLILQSPTSHITNKQASTTAFTKSRPLHPNLSFGQVQMGNASPFEALLVRPGAIHLSYAKNKDIRLEVLIEYSQDSRFSRSIR